MQEQARLQKELEDKIRQQEHADHLARQAVEQAMQHSAMLAQQQREREAEAERVML
jgi:hypothetical protein